MSRSGGPVNYFSIYDNKTDECLLAYASSEEAAAYLGIRLDSFYCRISRERLGRRTPHRKQRIIMEEPDEV